MVATTSKKSRVWMVGIKGVGMAALAQILKAKGFLVSGSDTKEHFFTDQVLNRLKIPVKEYFADKNLPKNTDLVIASTAYLGTQAWQGGTHPEVKEAKRRNISILSYSEALAKLFNETYGIAVCGSHGKSTTAALLGVTLEKLGYNPTVAVGTMVKNWGTNARVNKNSKIKNQKSKIFVIEADEYREAFLHYWPKGIVLTNIEYDHPDYFKNFAVYRRAFQKFLDHLPQDGFLVAGGDDPTIQQIIQRLRAQGSRFKILPYGFGTKNELRIKNYELRKDGLSFSVEFRRKSLGRFTVPLYGKHHALNAAAVIATCLLWGAKPNVIRRALKQFKGTARRFEFLSRYPLIIDDYAHHPTEIQVTLETTRELFGNREIWAVFQPHTHSRTEALLNDFAKSFGQANKVFILETYSSARERGSKNTARKLAKAVAKNHPSAKYLPSIPTAIKTLRKLMQTSRSILIITLGAGDVWQVGKNLV